MGSISSIESLKLSVCVSASKISKMNGVLIPASQSALSNNLFISLSETLSLNSLLILIRDNSFTLSLTKVARLGNCDPKSELTVVLKTLFCVLRTINKDESREGGELGDRKSVV